MRLSEHKKKIIIDVLKKHQIKKAGIFGSFARGDAVDGVSDLDLIVELSRNDLFALSALKNDLEEKLKINVDIITYSGLERFAKKEHFKQEVSKHQEYLI